MGYIVAALGILCVLLLGYILFLRKQVTRINYILQKRLQRGSGQVVSLELLDSKLNQLAVTMNQCLKAEETLRLKVVHEENDFRQLIANISHDLRTPLTAIKGYLQLMEKEELSLSQRKRAAIIEDHANELEYLIQQFYEYSYLLDATPVPEMSIFSLSNMVTECLAAAIPELEKKGLTLSLEESNVWVNADSKMTLRIIQNLVRNCVAHAYHTVKVELKELDKVELHISNDVKPGSTIEVERIFERFYVAEPSRKTTGLGLSIVKLLATSMGCEVEASVAENWFDIQCSFEIRKKERETV